MATHKSAIKRHRQSIKRRTRNRQARATLRTAMKNAFAAMEAKDLAKAEEATKVATRLLDKAVIHGLIHKNNGQNKISGLMRRLAATRGATASR